MPGIYKNARERTLIAVNYNQLKDIELTDSGFPIIKKQTFDYPEYLIGFNEVRTAKRRDGVGVHFFIDDYQFERIWAKPQNYIELLAGYSVVMAPDFSLYLEYPEPLKIWNHYRSQLIGAIFQKYDIPTIATASWAEEESFKWCFDGIEEGAAVAISTVGIINQGFDIFMSGLNELIERKRPKELICYGKIPEEMEKRLEETKTPCRMYKTGISSRIERWSKEIRIKKEI